MSSKKHKIALTELKDRFNAYLHSAAPGKEITYFGRDSIVGVLGEAFEHVSPPFPKLMRFWDRLKVRDYYRGKRNDSTFIAAHQEKVILINVFARFLSERGDSSYILFSDGFYDDPSEEETKAFSLSLDYDLTQFMKEEALTALMAAADTIVSSVDFSHILIFFHHDLYELYDNSFKEDFSAFAARQQVCLRKDALPMKDVWIG
jgi:hypothetical protein